MLGALLGTSLLSVPVDPWLPSSLRPVSEGIDLLEVDLDVVAFPLSNLSVVWEANELRLAVVDERIAVGGPRRRLKGACQPSPGSGARPAAAAPRPRAAARGSPHLRRRHYPPGAPASRTPRP
jgi:hypothetical protein